MKSATDVVDVNNALAAAEARLVESDRPKAELTEALTIAENERDKARAMLAAASMERDETRTADSSATVEFMSAENHGLRIAEQSMKAEIESRVQM